MSGVSQRFALVTGALLAALGVGLGAFGAHGLQSFLGARELQWWQTAVQYQMWHAIGLLAIGAAGRRDFFGPAVMIAAGTVVFSGSLFVMALTGMRFLGMVTPFGGGLMILGWLWLAWRARRVVGSIFG